MITIEELIFDIELFDFNKSIATITLYNKDGMWRVIHRIHGDDNAFMSEGISRCIDYIVLSIKHSCSYDWDNIVDKSIMIHITFPGVVKGHAISVNCDDVDNIPAKISKVTNDWRSSRDVQLECHNGFLNAGIKRYSSLLPGSSFK